MVVVEDEDNGESFHPSFCTLLDLAFHVGRTVCCPLILSYHLISLVLTTACFTSCFLLLPHSRLPCTQAQNDTPEQLTSLTGKASPCLGSEVVDERNPKQKLNTTTLPNLGLNLFLSMFELNLHLKPSLAHRFIDASSQVSENHGTPRKSVELLPVIDDKKRTYI